MVTIFSLLAELKRDLISDRTKIALAQAKAAGKKLCRPKGPGKSMLDGREDEIKDLLSKGVNKANIARILGVAWGTTEIISRKRNCRAGPNSSFPVEGDSVCKTQSNQPLSPGVL